MEVIEFYNDHQVCIQAEKSEVEDYIQNMVEVQQAIIDRYNGKATEPLINYLLKRDVTLPEGVTLKNAWCYNMQVLDDGNYQLDLEYDKIIEQA